MNKTKKKIAVLGGGMSALTAAYQLSGHEEYDITVYQMGWRLGGKGASGRNPEMADRIEEHGLHVWFGFYENAFSLMRQVYGELGRPAGTPLATVEDAFKPVNELTMKEIWGGKRLSWTVGFPHDHLKPGSGGEAATLWSSIDLIVRWIIEFAEGSIDQADENTGESESHVHHRIEFPDWVKEILEEGEEVTNAIIRTEGWFLRQALKLWMKMEAGKAPAKHHHSVFAWLMEKAMTRRWDRIRDQIETDDHVRRSWTLLYLACTTFTGLIKDEVLLHGFTPLDELDMVDWFYRHKLVDSDRANEIAYRSAPSQTVYDLFFHYVDGDTGRPAISAGIAIRSLLRILAGYKGSVLWFMQAGMGDTVFGPLYEVLRRRGVKFKFFHRVTNIGLSEDAGAKAVETVTISRQVNLSVGEYDPMVMVKGLPCWPSNPLYDQIVEGAALKASGANLERSPEYGTWKDTGGTVTLRAGVDFDEVILGITLAALIPVTQELVKASDSWRKMCEQIRTVQTQAIQVWFNRDSEGLGIDRPRPVVGAYVEPYASVTDFSHLIKMENWSDDQHVKHLSYSCGVMQLKPDETQPEANARARKNGLDLLNNHAASLWPKATDPENPDGLDWNAVVAPGDIRGEQRFDAQYIRANIDTNEQYVQSLPNTNQYRLKADASGFKRLILTGTWIDSGFNIACIESAAISGIQAARVLTGTPSHVKGEDDRLI
jgi:uncharacterized protein with NAD-binding domain and iron-sulfur cluster